MQSELAHSVHQRRGVRVPQHEFTEVTYEYDGRGSQRNGQQPTLCGACGGAVLGLLMIIGATVLLWRNEGSAVKSQLSFFEAERALASSGDSGGLIHVSGKLTAEASLEDGAFGVHAPPSISLQRHVEVFLWKEHVDTKTRRVPDGRGGSVTEKTKTYHYSSDWSPTERRSDQFKHEQDHRNPRWDEALASASMRTGLPFGAESWNQPRLLLHAERGALTLGATLSRRAERPIALAPEPRRVEEATRRARPSTASSREAHHDGLHVYSDARCAPPHQPSVGCVRVGWRHAPLDEVSVLAAAGVDGRLEPWANGAGAGYELGLLRFGRVGASTMLADAAASASASLWLWRALGGLVACVGYGLLLGPAHYLASWIPLLGGVVGCLLSAVAIAIGLAHTCVLVALAWVAHRPTLAAALVAIAACSLLGGAATLRSARRPTKSSTPMSGR